MPSAMLTIPNSRACLRSAGKRISVVRVVCAVSAVCWRAVVYLDVSVRGLQFSFAQTRRLHRGQLLLHERNDDRQRLCSATLHRNV